jgi:hypothetical protein
LLVQVQVKVLLVDIQMEQMDVPVVEEHKLLVELDVLVVLAVAAEVILQEVFYRVVQVLLVMPAVVVVGIMGEVAVQEIVDLVQVDQVVVVQVIIIQL